MVQGGGIIAGEAKVSDIVGKLQRKRENVKNARRGNSLGVGSLAGWNSGEKQKCLCRDRPGITAEARGADCLPSSDVKGTCRGDNFASFTQSP